MLPAIGSLPQNGSIVSRWYLGEASGDRTDSVGANTLADNNTVLSGTGQFNENAADFEAGNSEFLSKTDTASLSLTGDFSGFAWVKLESLPSNSQYAFFTKSFSSGDQRAYIIYITNYNAATDGISAGAIGLLAFLYPNGNGTGLIYKGVDCPLSVGAWAHIGIVYDASAGEVQFYLNGSPQGAMQTGFPNSIADTSASFIVGSVEGGGSYFDGLMQDMILWNAELSDANVASLYNAYFPTSSGFLQMF